MKCDKELITHWLAGELSAADKVAFEKHLSSCSDCRHELQKAQQLWNVMDGFPKENPSPYMEVRFKGMLDGYKQSIEKENSNTNNFFDKIRRLWIGQQKLQFGYGIVLLLIGLGIGYLLNYKKSNDQQLMLLTAQVQEMRQTLVVSKLESSSASNRIQAVNYTEEIKEVNQQVAGALFTTLNEDANVNVRLAALQALARFGNNPLVREGLIKSIILQESPLVQSVIADVMLKLREKRAVEPLRQLLRNENINPSIKEKIENTITKLEI